MSITETRSVSPAGTVKRVAVYAIIPAYAGPDLLAQALRSLVSEQPQLAGAIVVNNAGDPATEAAALRAALPVIVLNPKSNLGTAGGIAAGLREMLTIPEATHAWILDDDSIANPGALPAMLSALRDADADAAAPLIADEHGRVRWIPCRLPRDQKKRLRRGLTPVEFEQVCGSAPRPWNWAIWASVLISRRVVEAVGYPRLELWSQFTDIEYTLRITERFRAVLAPRAVCQHLPPLSEGAAFDAKLFAALQNGAFVALRMRSGRRALRHLPGQIFRYVRHYHWRPAAWWRAARAGWEGGVLGRPSGRTLHAALLARAEAAWTGPLRRSVSPGTPSLPSAARNG